MADFDFWRRENLVKFATEAQKHLVEQEMLILQLHEAIKKLEQELAELRRD